MNYIKGFNEDLRCREMQFEIGKEYKIDLKNEEMRLCSDTVFHFCKSFQQVHAFYSVLENNRFCEIKVLGELVEDDEKCGSNHIKVIREIKGNELSVLLGKINGNTGVFNIGEYNAGDYNTGDANTGHRNTGACNTGDRNTGDCNTGVRNTGDYNTGNYNTGSWNTGTFNTGEYNAGEYNAGDANTGHRNTGACNAGDRNTGCRNTGHWNTGSWNTCDRSTGFFNTKEQNIMMFNKDSGMSYQEFYNTEMYKVLHSSSFKLIEWIQYTDDELINSPIRQCIGGYLKQYTFKEACKNWWDGMSEKNKYIVQQIPNFDVEIFEEITGIKL